MEEHKKALVIGAGIVGLATARALAIAGYDVTVFDRSGFACSASIRNFGMIWPIGQPSGTLYSRAIRSRNIWKEIASEAGIWHDEVGSLHLAYANDELEVMTEFVEHTKTERKCSVLSPAEALAKSPSINPLGLKGALWSPDEMIVEAREAIAQIATYLQEKLNVKFHWNTAISHINSLTIRSGKQSWSGDQIYICSGADFETLYPEAFHSLNITKCKVQMQRLGGLPNLQRIGPSLCGGLSMAHYTGFRAAPSLEKLKIRYAEQYTEYLKWGIHVMVSQNQHGELTVGDSHEYGLTHDPFDRNAVNQLILELLGNFTTLNNQPVVQTWHGIYPKMTDGATECVISPEDGVTIINGLSGAGMTLSFGLAEEVINGQLAVTRI